MIENGTRENIDINNVTEVERSVEHGSPIGSNVRTYTRKGSIKQSFMRMFTRKYLI